MNYFIFDLDNTLYQESVAFSQDSGNEININNKADVERIKKLSKIGKLILLSNGNDVHCSKWLQYLNIMDYFSVIISYDTFNIYKPNPLIYEKVVENCGIKLDDNVFYFDDIPLNLLPAYKIKWNTILIKKNRKINIASDNIYIHYEFDNINSAIDFVVCFLE